jgi:hypothetical protein
MIEKLENRRVVLKVFARPVLVALVSLDLRPQGSGTEVSIAEEPAPDTFMRRIRFLIDPLVHVRNAIGMRHLKKLVEERHRGTRSHA